MSTSTDVELEEFERYEIARDRAAEIRAAWDAEGRPILFQGPRGGLRPHPLLSAVRAAEMHAHRLGMTLRKRPPGRPPVAVMAPSPAKKLRAGGV